MKWKHQIPEIYRKIFPSELLEADLSENKATCGACAMSPEARGPKAQFTYQSHLKCCTFEPFLPNFLVGALLQEEGRFPYGVHELRKKIQNREGALPIGMVPDLPFQIEFNNRQPNDFGNREEWLCRYYRKDTQDCGVWKYRGAVCTTYYCMSDFGASGKNLWGKLSGYMSEAEMALMEEALTELDFSPRQVSDCLAYVNRAEASEEELRSRSLSNSVFKRLWNGYENEIEDFYKKCYAIALKMDREHFVEMVGKRFLKNERQLLAHLHRLQQKGRDGT